MYIQYHRCISIASTTTLYGTDFPIYYLKKDQFIIKITALDKKF